MQTFFDITQSVQLFFLNLWWLWAAIILFLLGMEFWLSYAREYFKRTQIKWVLFEIRIPRLMTQSPRAMEQILTGLYSVKNSPTTVYEKYWDGEVTMWFSLEIVSFGGEIHFFVRVPGKHRNIVEGFFYAHYPDIELTELHEDYMTQFPSTIEKIHRNKSDIYGTELIFVREYFYPLRTYIEFENPKDEREVDSIAALLEILAKQKPGQNILIQILIQPAEDDWHDEADLFVKQIVAKRKKEDAEMAPPPSPDTSLGRFFSEQTFGEYEQTRGIQRKAAKPGFHTILRYMYISPIEGYDEGFARRGIYSSLNQYASIAMNKFKHNYDVSTFYNRWWMPKAWEHRIRNERKEHMYQHFRNRDFHQESFISELLNFHFFHWGLGVRKSGEMILNTEEIATLYHMPTLAVKMEHMIQHVPSKKGAPPAGLPISGVEIPMVEE